MFDDLTKLNQLNSVCGKSPSTVTLNSRTHLLFKVCRANICPCIENCSIMSCQNIVIMSFLFKERKFDVTGLIPKNMMDCIKMKHKAHSYDLLPIRIFKYSRVKLDNRDKVDASEFFDSVSLAHSSIRVNDLSELKRISLPPPLAPRCLPPANRILYLLT